MDKDEIRNAVIQLALLVDCLDDMPAGKIKRETLDIITDTANTIAKLIGYNGEYCALINEHIHEPYPIEMWQEIQL